MPRGFVWGTYFDDSGQTWGLRVDDDYFRQPERGWFTQATPGAIPFPRGWRPRRVQGMDPLGNIRTAVSPSTSSPIWTGGSPTFRIEANDQTIVQVVITHWLEEIKSPRP